MQKKTKMAAQLSSHPTIFEGVKYGLEVIGKKDLTLKDEQLTILKIITVQKRDVLPVLPTGFGKSLVYQLIAPFADFMAIAHRPTVNESIVLVISPLTALIRDQVSKLKESGLKACILKGDRVALDEDGDEEHVSVSEPVENLKNFQVIFAHPEALVENKATLKILKTEEFQNRVRAIVVDEAHLVVDWKDFRPSYGRLGRLGSIFPNVPWLGLTATATKKVRAEIIDSLGMFDPIEILANPDRPNIYFSTSTRPDRVDDKLDKILRPMVEELKKERLQFPLTVVFGNLETISSCYAYFSYAMKKEQYEPAGATPKAVNRLFTQFHAQYPQKEKDRIIDGLTSGTSKLRIIFATVAFGVGLDLKNIRQIIHVGVPCTMEEYFQEAGRAGRDGFPSKAHMFYNSYDISKARKHLSPVMREYVQSDKCKREMIMSYFGFQPLPLNSDQQHQCCDYHEKCCKCEDCLLSTMASMMDPPLTDKTTQICLEEMHLHSNLTAEEKTKLYEELVNFRLSLPGHGRTSVGSTSLCSGVTIELINEVVDKAHTFSSVEDLETRLPVFSHSHAVFIWNIVKQHI